MRTHRAWALIGLGASLSLGACAGEEAAAGEETAVAAPAVEAPAAPAAVQATGNVIEVKMITNGAINAFEPAQVTARQGDVIRFVLDSGVHNVSFPADKNAGAANLPAPSAYLQQPGQAHEVTVGMAPGSYTFQCDPHVMMGMVGTLTVR